jgi:hypothetical protein
MEKVPLYELLIWCQAGSQMAKKELLSRWEFDWDELVREVEHGQKKAVCRSRYL